MSNKKTSPAQKPATSAPAKPKGSADGFKNAEERFDVAGFWQPALGPLQGQVLGAYEFKQKTGRGKGETRRVFVVGLTEPCRARVKLEGGGFDDDAELAKGELVGVFYSAGLRELNNLLGCHVNVRRLPDKKETARGPMWVFVVFYKGTKKPVPVRPAFESAPREPEEDASFDPDSFSDAF